MEIPKLITILGPTAVGKTRLSSLLAYDINAEIISADSRQVYKGMTIGTGKDLEDYIVNGKTVTYHLIDIASPTEEFNVFKFKEKFKEKAQEILNKKKDIILCGGTGLYIDSILRDYFFIEVPKNENLRTELNQKTLEELINIIISMKNVHNKTDLEDKERIIRAIEIETHNNNFKNKNKNFDKITIKNSLVFGVHLSREKVRSKITNRLEQRIKEGMIEEVETLIKQGVDTERLISLGLEYKYVTFFLQNKINKDEMFLKLNTAIHQFSKRQMSWFRRMERLGININWIDGDLPLDEKVEQIKSYL